MSNEKIGQILKESRKRNHLSVHETGIILYKQYGHKIADKTIYGWESNQAHPTVDTFLELCEIYQIQNLSLFMEKDGNNFNSAFKITSEERRFLSLCRKNPLVKVIMQCLLKLVCPDKNDQKN